LFGFFFRIAVFFYLSIYTYFLLIEASYYNNHYYFIALLLLIIFFTGADNYGSIKYLYQKYRYKKEAEPVPVWNYFLLRFQVFLVYFVAGFVKLNFDWISTNTYRCIMDYGTEYPKNNIFYHSNFGIYFFTFGGLLFDLIIPLLLIQKRWRMYAIPAILTFHAINAATLNIGVFPYLMAGATLIFFRNDIIDYWKQLFSFKKTKISFFSKINSIPKPSKEKGIFSKKNILYYFNLYFYPNIFTI
jgi:vitamin K-dependent gamma-carboxylase